MERLRFSPARVYTVRELAPGATTRQHEYTSAPQHTGRERAVGDVHALLDELDAQQQQIQQLRAEIQQQQSQIHALSTLAAHHAAQFSATITAIPGGVWICDKYGRLTNVSASALTMFGLVPSYATLHNINDIPRLFASDSPDRDVYFGLRTALTGRSVQRELMLRPAHDTSRIVAVTVTATPMRNANDEIIGAVAVVHDISEQKVMERVKDDFLSVAAHELKTPVTAIKGYAQLALMRLSSGNMALLKRALQTIDEQAGRMTHLVGELIDASRIQGGELEIRFDTFDLEELVDECMAEAQHRTQQHHIRLHAPMRLVGMWDAHRIRQVIENLLDNAIKYSPNGGPIEVVVRVLNDAAHVTVEDHGVGIAPDKQAHVFDAWFQAHGDTVGDFGGMGLGLNICKEIIERHGGAMWVHSVEGQGSLFGFTLPLSLP